MTDQKNPYQPRKSSLIEVDRSKWNPLLRIDCIHEYYKDKICRDLALQPTPFTLKKFAELKLKWVKNLNEPDSNSSFTVYARESADPANPPLRKKLESTLFSVEMHAVNIDFWKVTDTDKLKKGREVKYYHIEPENFNDEKPMKLTAQKSSLTLGADYNRSGEENSEPLIRLYNVENKDNKEYKEYKEYKLSGYSVVFQGTSRPFQPHSPPEGLYEISKKGKPVDKYYISSTPTSLYGVLTFKLDFEKQMKFRVIIPAKKFEWVYELSFENKSELLNQFYKAIYGKI
jgi:hypothetical protein